MAISVYGIGSGNFSGSLTTTATTTVNTNGDQLIGMCMHSSFDSANPTMSCADGQGSYVTDANHILASAYSVTFFRLGNANAGSHTATFTASAGLAANSYGGAALLAVSGLAASPLDQTIFNTGSSKTPTTGTTGSLTNPNELILAGLIFSAALTGYTTPPTGGPGTYTDIATVAAYGYDSAYQLNTSGLTGYSAAWGTANTAGSWCAGIATYQSASLTIYPIPPGAKQTFVNEIYIQV